MEVGKRFGFDQENKYYQNGMERLKEKNILRIQTILQVTG